MDNSGLSSDKPKKLGRVSGGSGKGGRESVTCDHCDGKMRYVGKALTREEAEAWVRAGPTHLSDYNPQSKAKSEAA